MLIRRIKRGLCYITVGGILSVAIALWIAWRNDYQSFANQMVEPERLYDSALGHLRASSGQFINPYSVDQLEDFRSNDRDFRFALLDPFVPESTEKDWLATSVYGWPLPCLVLSITRTHQILQTGKIFYTWGPSQGLNSVNNKGMPLGSSKTPKSRIVSPIIESYLRAELKKMEDKMEDNGLPSTSGTIISRKYLGLVTTGPVNVHYAWIVENDRKTSSRNFGYRAIPYRPIWIGLIGNTLIFALTLFGLLWSGSKCMRAWRLRRGICTQCGYDLRGEYIAGCPECGWDRDDKEMKRTQTSTKSLSRTV